MVKRKPIEMWPKLRFSSRAEVSGFDAETEAMLRRAGEVIRESRKNRRG